MPFADKLQWDEMNQGPRRFLAFMFLNTISWQCLIGAILVLHARALGIESGVVGILFSLLYFTDVLGFLTKPLAERYGSRRVLMTGWTARNVLIMPVVFTPFVLAWWGPLPAAVLLFTTTTLFTATRSLATIAWSSWLHEIVPGKQLGRFYAAETSMGRLLAVVFGIFCFVVLGHNPPVWRFSAVAAVGVVFGLLSIRTLRKVPGGLPANQGGKMISQGYGPILRDRKFMGFLGCVLWFGFIYVGQSLLVLLFLRDQLSMGPGLILLLTTCGNLIAIPTSTRWRRIADRHGSQVVMAAAGILVVICLSVIACLRPGHAPFVLVALVCALLPVAECGNYVAVSRGYMLRMRPELRHATNAVWSSSRAIPYGISAVLMGFWLQHGTTWHYSLAALICALIMLIGVWICMRLPIPEADRGCGGSDVYDPHRPFAGMLTTLRYVLRPAPSVVCLEVTEHLPNVDRPSDV